jgi:hypothetical protein
MLEKIDENEKTVKIYKIYIIYIIYYLEINYKTLIYGDKSSVTILYFLCI